MREEICIFEQKLSKMANKRELKRHVNYMVFDVIDECFMVQDLNPDKKESTEKVIDHAVAFHDEILGAISSAKNKKEFKPILEKIATMQGEYVEMLNGLN